MSDSDYAHYSDGNAPSGNPLAWREFVFQDGWGDEGCNWGEGLKITIYLDGRIDVYVAELDNHFSGAVVRRPDVTFTVEIKLLVGVGKQDGRVIDPKPYGTTNYYELFEGMSYGGHKEMITVPFPPRPYMVNNIARADSFACYRHSIPLNRD